MTKIKYGNSTIQYSVIKSKRRKTSEIQVDEKGVVIRTPIGKTPSEIERIVQGKSQWIFKKQLEFKARNPQKRSRKYSKTFLLKRADYFAKKIGVTPKTILFKGLKSRWGSVTKDGTVSFNENLLWSPPKVIDYVIVHELCHLRIRDHSHHYWSLVHRFMPDYKQRKEWLDRNGMLFCEKQNLL